MAAARRFIPAYAGNAQPGRRRCPLPPVHPRIRGERYCKIISQCVSVGSSPHTRGTHLWSCIVGQPVRFIPAYAGNAPAPGAPVISVIGSSPHTRGTPHAAASQLPARRFIPAYAGNAARGRGGRFRVTVHPRIRGERSLSAGVVIPRSGSSPHTRGTPPFEVPAIGRLRFIPAYAGNAHTPRHTPSYNSVHPRIRGERQETQRQYFAEFGSSPHTRGTLQGLDQLGHLVRFIPAYAGNAQILEN